MTGLLLRRVELSVGVRDVAVRDGRVAQIGIGLAADGAEVIDGRGGALLPGLHDHHLHLHAMAADAASVRCGPPQVRTPEALARALDAAPGDGWIRGVGYVETVAGLLDAAALDRLHARRPVRVQHRSGALWILNSAASSLVGLESADHRGVERDDTGRPTGRVWRADAWLRERLPATGPPPLDAVGTDLTRFGITGVTDATPDLPPDSLAALIDAHTTGALPQRLHLLGAPVGDDPASRPATVTTGPYKIVLADSGLPDFEALSAAVRRAHAHGRPVAVHCVSREALLLLLAVFDEVGTLPGDRIEHGALIPAESIPELRRHDLCVVTQPGFLTHRGDDYLDRVDPRDLPDLYRCRSLLDNAVPLAMSSDAPYGPLDPWAVIAAATTRRAPTGHVVGAPEKITAAEALDRYLTPLDDPGGEPRRLEVGAPADLILFDRPLTDVLTDPSAQFLRCTISRGQIRHYR
ncbi:amidohydrolase family protein [Rhodococcus rhodochrous]|uniref:Amidohydrolase n=1 Tax=Rhodococcus rhodochrous KG-21 TaxID=1441923 RepID=A0A0M8PE69_RHORH|nr:amidohydrolase family protein [Rhodococcus rhodochrous]KOS53115.1 amidohydrolase [Rhodococcus rhodochrous KG-21]